MTDEAIERTVRRLAAELDASPQRISIGLARLLDAKLIAPIDGGNPADAVGRLRALSARLLGGGDTPIDNDPATIARDLWNRRAADKPGHRYPHWDALPDAMREELIYRASRDDETPDVAIYRACRGSSPR